jgi:uncharacterized membrane protein
MREYLTAWLAAALVMGSLDFAWLRLMVGQVYQPAVGGVLADKPNMGAAVAFYAVYLVGVVLFAVRPALEEGDWRVATLWGAAFGFFAYATYDLTNLATLKVWSLKLSLIDIAWGAFLTATTATAAAATALALEK